MNFETMPWLRQEWGVVAATALMVALSGGAMMLFRWKDWL
jgi:Mg2+ and Co2+ transporter CorA